MFMTLLLVTFIIATLTSFIIASVFKGTIKKIISRIVSEEIGSAWNRYILFALYVVGISGGVRIWDIEKYITPRTKDEVQIVLNMDRWVLEVYRTIIGTLQSVAWMLLVVFLISLVAYVMVRGFELKKGKEQ